MTSLSGADYRRGSRETTTSRLCFFSSLAIISIFQCRTTLALLTAMSFLLGALCSGVAGYVGMWVSVRANVRVSGAARRSAREALQIALRAGGFSALVVLGMVRVICTDFGVLGRTFWPAYEVYSGQVIVLGKGPIGELLHQWNLPCCRAKASCYARGVLHSCNMGIS